MFFRQQLLFWIQKNTFFCLFLVIFRPGVNVHVQLLSSLVLNVFLVPIFIHKYYLNQSDSIPIQYSYWINSKIHFEASICKTKYNKKIIFSITESNLSQSFTYYTLFVADHILLNILIQFLIFISLCNIKMTKNNIA